MKKNISYGKHKTFPSKLNGLEKQHSLSKNERDNFPFLSNIPWDNANQGSDKNQLKGAKLIQEFVKHLPHKPGVYRMFDENGNVLYIGKARNLKKRVSNYTCEQRHNNRITRMIRATYHMEFVVTHTETEALLLEANLIKRLHPRFNVLLRDDKSFPYIIITENHRAPALYKHRGARTRKAHYFGPFASSSAVTQTINVLQRAFLLRTCTDSVLENRTRPCLLYQIKRCSAPCTHEINENDYRELVRGAKAFLSGKSQSVKNDMIQAMHKAAEDLDFEQAAVYRDRLSALSHIQSHQGINPQTIEEADVFAIAQKGGITCIQVFFFRMRQNWGNRSYFPKADPSFSRSEILASFLAQFYDDKPLPKLILLSEEIEEKTLLAEAFSLKANRKIFLSLPKQGERKTLVNHAYINAYEALGHKLAETATHTKLLQGIAEVFQLPQTPHRIEVYDNSHLMGTNAVGAMIVADQMGFLKNQYRKFNIHSTDITPGDDFGMMKEVIKRRFSRLIKEHGLPHESNSIKGEDEDCFSIWPNLILIDGGEGQINSVHTILSELKLDDFITVVGIAKGADRGAGHERFFIKGKTPFTLPPHDPILYFLQRLRDEAHRFAIKTHRIKRKKATLKNPLDEIKNIGPTRKRALLHHFGSAKIVASTSLEDLTKVTGISVTIAQKIHNHFNEK
ncbi:excinuclease ABC subunit UvrC [Bartonella quintana]|uniref:UvrABC system protein C n=1 Tax=Bartonella quintana JK 68 TaxID=1134503 RepID=A0ABR4SQX8_BARQI|nr:excinuclease ABC subunit UvrC [Bartonella quintana]ETS11634.1 UvrABC system protein C [Bartonella quintana BQ2-D70]ETS18130.1 UvrABC system protein C [Bartonella quintana JK 7]ETS18959.1 UvrABC system protein C [Bartonella quintana JK 12]KEC60569.1 UvrABC system protein C [Bartonella quintana JK 31]KEC61768.1 UvrABC system protein C [Bartonella quintana JK 63]